MGCNFITRGASALVMPCIVYVPAKKGLLLRRFVALYLDSMLCMQHLVAIITYSLVITSIYYV